MVKASAKTSVKSKKTNGSAQTLSKKQEKSTSKMELPPIEEKNLPEITIAIENYENIFASFPSTFILTKCQYAGTDFGEVPQILMTDDPVITVNHEIKLKCESEFPLALEKLVANPVILKIFQFSNPGSKIFVDDSNTTDSGKGILEDNLSLVDSVISLYEALTGDIVEKIDLNMSSDHEKKGKTKEKRGKKDKKGSKSNTGSKESGSKKSLKTRSKEGKKLTKEGSRTSSKKGNSTASIKTSKQKENNSNLNEVEIGTCVIDLLPLAFGKSTFSEFILLIPPQPLYDDRMKRYSQKPGIHVTVSLDKPFEFVCKPNLLNLTIDSIYNIPSLMNEEMEYQIIVTLPSVDLPHRSFLIKDGEYTSSERSPHKQWPGIPKNYSNITLYKTDYNPDKIKNYVENVHLEEVFNGGKSRIEFNFIKRNILLKEGFLALYDQIRKYRRIVLEMYISNRKPENTKELKSTSYLHLMAVVDLSSLLYPGVTKLQIAAPITTFHGQEALRYGGLKNSYFFPSEPQLHEKSMDGQEIKPGKVAARSSSKETKKSKDSKDSKNTKKSKKTKEAKKPKGKKGQQDNQDDLNMQNKLPSEPCPEILPEPSKKVYDENGNATFIILEIELTEPLVQKRKFDDLHGSLKELVQRKPTTPKVIFDNQLATQYYNHILKEIINLINKKYFAYSEKKQQCGCENQANFLTYLKRCGTYQNVLLTVIQIANFISQVKTNIMKHNLTVDQQQNFIEQIFVSLVNEVNQILHKLTATSCSIVPMSEISSDTLLFYAMEATEIGKLQKADEYYLKRLTYDSGNSDYWFDYAVFKMQCNEQEKAFMCLQEVLAKKLTHRNSLLLNGILLTEKRRLHEAELCFLTLMVHEPRWVEGWIVLYIFYKEAGNTGGMDLAKEMAQKYLEDPRSSSDDFSKREELVWTSSICPNTLFFKTSVLLLKMRVYSWVENALSNELQQTGATHYMLAVVCYYKKQYNHALEHLEKARFFHGSDFAVVSLSGHCYLALGNKEKALQEYSHVVESFERPDDIHLLYLNCAKIMSNIQEARKLLLLACKKHPTPYTWMRCGILYFKQNDLLSAEECLSESVTLDNSIGKSWGYLALINLKMKHLGEAEICYGLALKNKLRDEYILKEIHSEIKRGKSY